MNKCLKDSSLLIMSEILKGNLLYGQGGGPTSILNTSAYELFKEAFKHEEIQEIYAAHYGIKGIINDDLILIKNDLGLDKLKNTPGAYYGSSRYKLDDFSLNEKDYIKILNTFKKYNIRYFFYNGGNDSMDTIRKIDEYFLKVNYECRTIGIIKTIDNDLPVTDFSLGYISAAKFIINTVIEISLDDLSYDVGRVNIIETMGRNVGWLAASTKLACLKGLEPDLIYVPETNFNLDDFLLRIKKIYESKHRAIVVVSEGIHDENNHFIFETIKKDDGFGHNQLGGVASVLASIISQKLGYKTRSFELSLLQRADSVSENKIEKNIAKKLSQYALKCALKGASNQCAIINRLNDSPYRYNFKLASINQIANSEKYLPKEYIGKDNCSINNSFINYLAPLIGGEKELLDIYKKK